MSNTDPAAALLAAIKTALEGSAELATAMGLAVARVYDTPPTNAIIPYVVIGDDQVIGDDEECSDSSEIFCTVHVWTKPDPPDASQARTIGGIVRAVLNSRLSVAGQDTVEWNFQDARYMTDPDLSTHLILVVHYFLTPN